LIFFDEDVWLVVREPWLHEQRHVTWSLQHCSRMRQTRLVSTAILQQRMDASRFPNLWLT
jgi:hypothetical protein